MSSFLIKYMERSISPQNNFHFEIRSHVYHPNVMTFLLHFSFQMNTNRRCGCKGFNSCYLCEAEFGLSTTEPALDRIESIQSQRIFCPLCRYLYDPGQLHICGQGQPFPGTFGLPATIFKNFNGTYFFRYWNSFQLHIRGRRDQTYSGSRPNSLVHFAKWQEEAKLWTKGQLQEKKNQNWRVSRLSSLYQIC